MILVPVITSAFVGLVCVGFIWFALIHGLGLGIHDQEEFEAVCTVISEGVEKGLENEKDFASIQSILEKNQLSLRITSQGEVVYSSEEEQPGQDIDKIRGLGLGADDYIEKPFSPGVLVARVKANLAQYRRLARPAEAPSEIALGGIRLNTGTQRVFVDGREVELKNREFELLLFLMLRVDLVFDRETLYEKVWGLEAMGDNATVAVHINRLREKIEKDPANPRYIQTVWGAGYRFGGC